MSEEGCHYLYHVCAVLGALLLGKWALGVLCSLVTGFKVEILSRLVQRDLVTEYGGKWAVVTGSTDGIGKEYARQLAQKGLNIVIIARSSEKLQKVAQEIRDEFRVDTLTIKADFNHGQPIYSGIAEALKGKDIGILVNNVGWYGPKPRKFLEMKEEDLWRYIHVNTASVLAMTLMILPQMVARGRGAIINISSLFSVWPVPLSGVYSATKAFVTFFSESLAYEYKDSGVTIQTVNPGYVTTNMTSYSAHTSTPGFMRPSANRYVTSALKTLGHTKVTAGTWDHALQTMLFKLYGKRLAMYKLNQYCEYLAVERKEEDKKTS